MLKRALVKMHVSNVVDNFNPAPHSCKRDYESYVST